MGWDRRLLGRMRANEHGANSGGMGAAATRARTPLAGAARGFSGGAGSAVR